MKKKFLSNIILTRLNHPDKLIRPTPSISYHPINIRKEMQKS